MAWQATPPGTFTLRRGRSCDRAKPIERTAANGVIRFQGIAGGEATIHAVRDLLVAKGLERKSVKWEKFW